MPRISYDEIPPQEATNPGSNGFDFFALKNDGDEAIVRIMHDTSASFNVFLLHDNVMINNKRRKVNCIRDPKAPLTECPLCAAGYATGYRIYINMLQYFQDPSTGAIIAKPVVWERSLSYAQKLKTLIDEYGPLSESMFKIKRNGAAGSMDTTYDILYCNPKVYNDAMYPKIDFPSVSIFGTLVLDKTAEDMNTYLATGDFPKAEKAGSVNTPQYTPKDDHIVTAPPEYAPSTSAIPSAQTPPWEDTTTVTPAMTPPPRNTNNPTPSTAPNRPARYY